ncbi:hypothetical protein QFZ50_001203 [Arthrobacter agilis]|nr:hypothetical protein [Arthrobacter agilis]
MPSLQRFVERGDLGDLNVDGGDVDVFDEGSEHAGLLISANAAVVFDDSQRRRPQLSFPKCRAALDDRCSGSSDFSRRTTPTRRKKSANASRAWPSEAAGHPAELSSTSGQLRQSCRNTTKLPTAPVVISRSPRATCTVFLETFMVHRNTSGDRRSLLTHPKVFRHLLRRGQGRDESPYLPIPDWASIGSKAIALLAKDRSWKPLPHLPHHAKESSLWVLTVHPHRSRPCN